MTKKVLLMLTEDQHATLKERQIDYIAEHRVKATLNDVLVELIRNSKPVSKATEAILKRAIANKIEKQPD